MALTYTYVNLENIIHEIADADLNYAGYWSSGSTYFFGDVVLYNDTRYLSLAASEAEAPPINEVRDDKWSVLVLAVTGSSAGSLSSDSWALANEAYGLATYAVSIAGTAGGGSGDATYAYNVAIAALETSWVGTSTGHEAYDVAKAALETAWVGTGAVAGDATYAYKVATAALTTSWAGTASAREARAVAQTGLTTSWAGTASAREARAVAQTGLETSWIGTSTGHEAYGVAKAALETSWAGTASAREARAVGQTALETAWSGTRLDTLSDVTITSPTASQSLIYDGSKWINGDPQVVVAPTYYTAYYNDTPSGISNFNTFTTIPSTIPEVTDTVNVGSATRGVFVEAYITGTLARTNLSGGLWEFNHYLSVDNAARPAVLAWDVFVRTAAGLEQFWFSGTSNSISSTTPIHDSVIIAQTSRNISATDRLLVRLWAYRNSPNAVNFSLYHNGGTHNSHIHSPFGVSHNDLDGLQGGQAAEYFHLTSDQADAAVGSSGSPSSSNKFVTQADTILANGAEARRLGSGAYNLAVIGTNAASAAQGSADTALAQLATVASLVFAGQSGTYNVNVAQVPNWKSDLPVTITNGVITAVGRSRFQFMCFDSASPGLTGTALGDLATGFTWGGTAVIQSSYIEYVVQPNDPIYQTAKDEFSISGTLGRHNLDINTGTGWRVPWIIQESFAMMGTDCFEDYPTGAFSPTSVGNGNAWGFVGTVSLN